LGLLTGASFQLRGLLLAVCLLFLVTIAVAITRRYDFLQTSFAVLAAQSVFQASYFVGLAALSSFHRLLERRPLADQLPGGARDQRSASVPYYGSWLSK
jgi:cytochrome c biogenesis factor